PVPVVAHDDAGNGVERGCVGRGALNAGRNERSDEDEHEHKRERGDADHGAHLRATGYALAQRKTSSKALGNARTLRGRWYQAPAARGGGVSRDPRETTLRILDQTFGRVPGGTPLRVRLWDGTLWPDAERTAVATIVLARPTALREMLLPGTEVGLARAYLHGAFDVEGSLEAALSAALPLAGVVATPSAKARL